MGKEKDNRSSPENQVRGESSSEAEVDCARQSLEPLKEIQDDDHQQNAESISVAASGVNSKNEGKDSARMDEKNGVAGDKAAEFSRFAAPGQNFIEARDAGENALSTKPLDIDEKPAKKDIIEPPADPENITSQSLLDESAHVEKNDEKQMSGQNENTPKRKINFFKAALALALISLLFGGFFVQGKSKKGKMVPGNDVSENLTEARFAAKSLPQESVTDTRDSNRVYKDKFKEAIDLRKSLLLKREEIDQLVKMYRKGVENLENQVLYEMLNNEINSYDKAKKCKRTELGLMAIQRRMSYIQQLNKPLHWLDQGSEELLYLKRKATFDLQMMQVASGIDMDAHIANIDDALQRYCITAEKLAIDVENIEPIPLIRIWTQLNARIQNNPRLAADIETWKIQQEICSGDLSRARELSTISIDTAKCIPNSKGTDLFLSNLTELTPQIAKELGQWQGKWICLNGINTLSPLAAQYLFQWKGDLISLNGLSEFPPELAEKLLQWKGKKLELMGLKLTESASDSVAIRRLAAWEKAGGKLYVPRQIRKKIKYS